MPQMAPMSWIMLFMFFSIMLIMINVLNYYSFNSTFKISGSSKNLEVKTNNWKW
nr:ATP synthase F0 subunit 8 [Trithemis aurora]